MNHQNGFRSSAVLLTLLLGLLLQPPRAQSHSDTGHGSPTAPGLPSECEPVTGLRPFVDPLPIPATALPARINPLFRLPWNPNIVFTNVLEYDMPMTSFPHRFHSDLPEVEVWGYAGSYPGPTLRAITNVPVLVNWINTLPPIYPPWLPANTSFHGVTNQEVRSVVHLHGAANLPRYDGYPTNDFKSGFSDTYLYNNLDLDGDGETLWYHDHAIGVTANNVYAGLEGFYLLTSPGFEQNFDLPRGDYEIPLVFQDRDVQTNCPPADSRYQGSLLYNKTNYASFPYHNLAVVNGVVTPYLEVEPRPYRFRVLNGANFRTFGLALVFTNTGLSTLPVTNLPIYVIGNEDGFLPQTVPITGGGSVNMMPGERLDLIMDFSPYGGSNVVLVNTILAGQPGGNAVQANAPDIINLMQFRVTRPWTGSNAIPTTLIPADQWVTTATMTNEAVINREITLDLANESPFPGPPFHPMKTNGPPFALINLLNFDDAITEQPRAGQTEIWSLINLTADAHPIHVHLLDFRVVDRQRFAGWPTTLPPSGVINYINDRMTPAGATNLASYLTTNTTVFSQYHTAQPFEAGPKDVVRVAPYSVTRIVMKWPTNAVFYSSPSAANLDPDTNGRYVYHCHLLEHEDDDMMRPLQVLPPPSPAPPLVLSLIPDPAVNPAGENHFTLDLQRTLDGETYQFSTTSELSPNGWSAFLMGVPGAAGSINVTPPSSTNSSQLYRASPFMVVSPPRASMEHP